LYPTEARTRNVEGVVVVDILVDTNGKIAETKVLSGPPMLQQAALDALRRWRYQPAQLNGQVIPIHTKVDINFALH
jgi:protein TonB